MADTGAGDGAEKSIVVIIMWGRMGGDEAAAIAEREVEVGFMGGRGGRRWGFWKSGEEEGVEVEVCRLGRRGNGR